MGEGMLPSSGVQALITRLRSQGIDSGREEAARIVDAARAEAAALVDTARMEAEAIRAQALESSAREVAGARAALELACRDALIQVREQLELGMVARLAEVVAPSVQRPDDLAALVAAVLRREVADRGEPAQGLLLVGTGAGAPAPDALTAALARDVLTRGLEVRCGVVGARSAVLRLAGAGYDIDIGAEALADLVAARLLPRFRWLLDHGPKGG